MKKWNFTFRIIWSCWKHIDVYWWIIYIQYWFGASKWLQTRFFLLYKHMPPQTRDICQFDGRDEMIQLQLMTHHSIPICSKFFQQLPQTWSQKWSQKWPQCIPMLPNMPLTSTFSHPPNVICRMGGACRLPGPGLQETFPEFYKWCCDNNEPNKIDARRQFMRTNLSYGMNDSYIY